ncbi:MAG: helicase-related protein [Gammaproteobacteria bacterium]
MPILIDNKQASVVEHLQQHLRATDVFRLVTAYFSIYGFEALATELENNQLAVKFLFGDPASAGNIGAGARPGQRFSLAESGLLFGSDESSVLWQKAMAQRCADWIRGNQVQVRSLRKANFLHGKMYHLQEANAQSVIVGSSNFTKRGLGASSNSNLEINLMAQNEQICSDTQQWFDALWQDQEQVEDVKQQVLDELERLYAENSPQLIYYKTLYELFKDDLEARSESDGTLEGADFQQSQIWQKLYEFQKDGAKSVIARLLRHSGCILADSVGLGKTFTALAVIKFFEMRNERVLVLCPKKLENNWRTYQVASARADNPLANDRFSYDLLMHSDLSRTKGKSGTIDLANFNWDQYGLIVIDESHNFRNASSSQRDEDGNVIRLSRYERLIQEVIQKGARSKVLLLSATPVNTSLRDLRNQINLMANGNNSAYSESLHIDSVQQVFKTAQKAYEDWSQAGTKTKEELLESLGGEFMHLLNGLTIARSRSQIKRFYSDFIKEQGDFPKRKLTTQYPQADNKGKLSYDDLNATISQLNFYIYRPSDYVMSDDDQHSGQKNREGFLVDMIRVNFLKRLESSAHALRLTLERTIGKMVALEDRIQRYHQSQESSQDDTTTDNLLAEEDIAEDDEFVINRKAIQPYHLRHLDTRRWLEDVQEDRAVLQSALENVQQIIPKRDGKLDALKQVIEQKSKHPNRKLLVFTAFKDTAKYLWEQLQPSAQELNLTMGMVAGDQVLTMVEAANFEQVLNRFAPVAREQSQATEEAEIDVLIATDCISEGQNLQDCDTVLNYDIHWNPVRLIQRFGRIDRIGSRNQTVHMINYWPTEDMELYLNLKPRVNARMALADATATGDEDFLNEDGREAAQKELDFRDQQVKSMQTDIHDLEDLQDSVTLSDLTLDYFLTQILRFLKQNKEKLDKIPPGAHAVTRCPSAQSAKDLGVTPPGAIFFLRQHEAAKKHPSNPVHPHYLVQSGPDRIHRSYRSAANILKLFEVAAAQQAAPLSDLCDAFNRQLETPEGRRYYSSMARQVVDNIEGTSNQDMLASLTRNKAAIVPEKSERPSESNLELITWLVLKDGG